MRKSLRCECYGFYIYYHRRSLSLTFDLLLDWFGRIEPMRDVVWIGVLKAEVVLLDKVQVKENML